MNKGQCQHKLMLTLFFLYTFPSFSLVGAGNFNLLLIAMVRKCILRMRA